MAVLPDFWAATFTDPATIDHPLWIFPDEVTATFATEGAVENEIVVVERLPGVRTILGVDCIRVRDRAYVDGLLIEDTEDWYAQDDEGNVWYMGEESVAYEYDDEGLLVGSNTEGSWEAGLDPRGSGNPARPGFAIPANPTVGDTYYQEFYEDVAEDIGRIVALNVPVTLSDGSMLSCVKTRDTSSLDPDLDEFKYYAAGIGVVLVEEQGSGDLEYRGSFTTSSAAQPTFVMGNFSTPDQIDHPLFPLVEGFATVSLTVAPDGTETTVVERLPGTRMVFGLPCAIVRDHVYADGLLIEDTEDWYAQDDAGNVWYMGEAVDNYEYDETGTLLGIDHDGSWEAGLDIASTGTIALPGYQMPAAAVAGTSYYQEFYPGEAEDQGLTVATDVQVDLPDGTTHSNCVRVLDWNPLNPGAIEYKVYAPGVGVVIEEALHQPESASRIGAFDQNAVSIPDFGGASFTNPTVIDNPMQPMPVGATWEYEAETDEGIETIVIEILPTTRVVAGVACVIRRDRVFLGALLVEDTDDWFAQDDEGNVWYFGESVVNYEYDEFGVLVGMDTDGSWEAGLDTEATGTPAAAGIQMWAAPVVGMSYFQEYYPTVAVDMGLVLATNVTLVTPNDETYTGCVKTLDWNPLHPDGLEYKYFAPGVGFVFEEKLHEGVEVELTATSL